MNCVKEFYFIKLSVACCISTKNCLTILIFIWLEVYNIKKLAQLRSVRKYKKDKDPPIIVIFDNLACTVCSIAIKDK
jgi:mitochondrial fission protein ELM1